MIKIKSFAKQQNNTLITLEYDAVDGTTKETTATFLVSQVLAQSPEQLRQSIITSVNNARANQAQTALETKLKSWIGVDIEEKLPIGGAARAEL